MEKETVVNEKNYYSRLDTFIRKNYPDIKLGAIYSLIRRGFVRVNGKRIKHNNYSLNIGDRVKIILNDEKLEDIKRPAEPSLKARHVDFDIIYEDNEFLVINKPAKVSVHPGAQEEMATIIEGVMYYSDGQFEPHLVHRLDKLTSGVMIIAKNKQTARELTELIKGRESKKFYLSLLVGDLKKKEGFLSTPVYGKEAYLEYKVIKKYKTPEGIYTLVEIELHTGRKHQIRIQFANLGYPIAGDDTYGNKGQNRILRKKYNLRRFFLHASKLSFNFKGQYFEFSAPLSEDLQSVLERLEKSS
ncbi:RluA family pseudouridine synthase [Petrotoga sp. 9PWA.NaAc.5.4]|uniref:RluA family pseudouridine synthase n=1 Tax=Petrotoga sp. 9PWA.NaAc.5.4 TaxID=1434328 RepID=UPI000CBF32C0|nr:RluA family pseudouridine synthase [Petrotoga sp. 9PWA.NaAc.5.4]PNR92315.1 pseudouridine synthase [Petrotoga sp. 9PWA.NaAc.5.4]